MEVRSVYLQGPQAGGEVVDVEVPLDSCVACRSFEVHNAIASIYPMCDTTFQSSSRQRCSVVSVVQPRLAPLVVLSSASNDESGTYSAYGERRVRLKGEFDADSAFI